MHHPFQFLWKKVTDILEIWNEVSTSGKYRSNSGLVDGCAPHVVVCAHVWSKQHCGRTIPEAWEKIH